jgi:hypothetical protein
MISDAVNVLLIDPMAKAVSGPGATSGVFTSAAPTPSDHAIDPSRTTAADTPGLRHSCCRSRVSRSSSAASPDSISYAYGRPSAR